MMAMRWCVVLRREVALSAQCAALRAQRTAMRLVTVAAGDAAPVREALHECAPFEHLVSLLAVGEIERRLEQRGTIEVEQPLAGVPSFGDLRAARMTRRARFDLGVGPALDAAGRVAGCGIDRPVRALALVERHGKASRRIAVVAVRPCDMQRARSVTGLASGAELRPRRPVRVARRVVILAHVDRVAVGAHEVPVLRAPRPVQLVAVVDLVEWIDMEPALAAPRLRPRVPRDRQRLQLASGELDQVLLQRIDAERVLHVEVLDAAAGVVGARDELFGAAGRTTTRRRRSETSTRRSARGPSRRSPAASHARVAIAATRRARRDDTPRTRRCPRSAPAAEPVRRPGARAARRSRRRRWQSRSRSQAVPSAKPTCDRARLARSIARESQPRATDRRATPAADSVPVQRAATVRRCSPRAAAAWNRRQGGSLAAARLSGADSFAPGGGPPGGSGDASFGTPSACTAAASAAGGAFFAGDAARRDVRRFLGDDTIVSQRRTLQCNRATTPKDGVR